MRFTCAMANKALKQAGYAERLTRGRGYYYFYDGDAFKWFSSSIPVFSIADWDAARIIAERNHLANN